MKKTYIFLIVLFYVTYASCSHKSEKKQTDLSTQTDTVIQVSLDTFSYKAYNNIAQILAGINPTDTSFLPQIVHSKEFVEHKTVMDKQWAAYSKNISTITNWSKSELGNLDSIFYPFGGPDFNYIASFFPDCHFSMLIGLEKAGKIPFSDDFSIKNAAEILKQTTKSVRSNIDLSFFQTNSMKTELSGYLEGTLPVIMMFMVRHNYEIININPVHINEKSYFEISNKEQEYAHTLTKDFSNAYEIVYKKIGENIYRYMYYFSLDLSDKEINEKTFDLLLNNYFHNKTTFLKAASYLLDRPTFTKIKKLILSHSKTIITGPSGIQYRDLDSSWNIQLYGNYVGPISLFSGRQQEDLKAAYQKGQIKPIDFKFDYHKVSSLLVAKKR